MMTDEHQDNPQRKEKSSFIQPSCTMAEKVADAFKYEDNDVQ